LHLKERVLPVKNELHAYSTMPLPTGLLAGLLTGPPAGFRELKLEGGGLPGNLDLDDRGDRRSVRSLLRPTVSLPP